MSRWTNNDMPHNVPWMDGDPLGGCRAIMMVLIAYGIAIVVAGIVYWLVWA